MENARCRQFTTFQLPGAAFFLPLSASICTYRVAGEGDAAGVQLVVEREIVVLEDPVGVGILEPRDWMSEVCVALD